MCLILLAWLQEAGPRLAVAANRDEFHERPAEHAAFRGVDERVLCGLDLQAGGTWLGVSRSGRFAAVTNIHGTRDPAAPHSRGELVRDFLDDSIAAGEYARSVAGRAGSYSGFNLLLTDGASLWSVANRGDGVRELPAGVYALGNDALDDPGLEGAKRRFRDAIAGGASAEPMFDVLSLDRIRAPVYGTRCSTVVLMGGECRFAERTFDREGNPSATRRFEFPLARGSRPG